ncbi:MAG: hypothetical protein KKE51_14470 [Gammaproteobacteria bacterium]|nr:hypothetical protein [Gammaproteobacteria bacterium]MBU1601913.1 hypothetical protein [Gammaproteobacteria bacterium]MBU2432285.1 hypothetical protein [Gammaproteobacteria bacterium]MBU2450322.1 hypothetical protein [Gammaproteobacteria bacterium]
MKLQHLSIGARFEYEGVTYVKTGPLTASSEAGGQRIIPRHAVLRPLDVPAAEGKGKLAAPVVRKAFNNFFETCHRLVGEAGQAELEQARQRFLKAID